MDKDHDRAQQRGLLRTRRLLRGQESALLPSMQPLPDLEQEPGLGPAPAPAPACANTAPFDASGVSAERLRCELQVACFNEQFLLAPVGYVLVGFDSAILQVNLAGAAMLGVARTHPAGQSFRTMIAPPFLPDYDAMFSRALNSSAALECRVRMLRGGDGAAFQATLRASADGSGQACRVVVEPAEGGHDALLRSEERFRRIVHSADEGIWEVDALANTTFVNPKMAAILGYSIEDMLARPLAAFMDGEGRAAIGDNIATREQGSLDRQECKFIGKDGAAVWTSVATHPIFDAGGACIGALALVTDITARKASTALIWRQANFDSLTGLPNRHMFMDRLGFETRKADRNASFLALLFIDLDHFKQINDRLGHAGGDQVLVEASRRIAACIRASDTLARLGGDEFTVILAGLDHAGSVERLARQMMTRLALPFALCGEQACISASIGIALYPHDAADIDRLVACADQAMYASKNAGGNRFSYFTRELQDAALARQCMAGDLREALRLGQFELAYQPIVSLRTGEVHQAEALLRWRHPVRGLLAPADFIPFAESNGLIVEIGDWVFREVAQQVQRWQRSISPQFQVSVNKSPVQFRHDADLHQRWLAYLDALGLPPQSIVIEITERVLLDGAEEVIERLRHYRTMGLQVALDDFGTGYASLSHLKRFDIDYVKIDRSFVATLEDDAGDLALCEAIIVMAHKLGLKVVAEGVETKVQRALLVDAGCDFAQGYVFARPMPADAFQAVVETGMPRFPH